MKKETKSLKELHKIRESIYEETKHMSVKEKVKYFNKKGQEARKRLGLDEKKVVKR
ncbi:MAG: hypothetical protein HQK50_11345 [Oligoflexia bacterium]|nr:hypothetical protein [Oligoflexia bacterium]MBF0366159.1 hypothetical protein [Oligoflexia bacterium]